jgi:hypothetical protein
MAKIIAFPTNKVQPTSITNLDRYHNNVGQIIDLEKKSYDIALASLLDGKFADIVKNEKLKYPILDTDTPDFSINLDDVDIYDDTDDNLAADLLKILNTLSTDDDAHLRLSKEIL